MYISLFCYDINILYRNKYNFYFMFVLRNQELFFYEYEHAPVVRAAVAFRRVPDGLA